MSDFTREEILEAFRGFDACAKRHDWEAAPEYFTDDARGGSVRIGILEGRDGSFAWMRSNPPDWGEPLVPLAPRRARRQIALRLRGLTEYVYAGGGRSSWAYSIFDTATIAAVVREYAENQAR